MMNERNKACLEYMQSSMRDSAHDAGHIFRVLDAAAVLAQKEREVDFDVLIPAVLLHDVGREEQFRTGESHALISARMARGFLSERGEEEALIRRVEDCIRTHSFRRNDPPSSVEARLLYDADKLDVVGAIGIARTFLYQGRVGEPIYSMGPDGAVLSGEEDIPSFFNEYRRKLRHMSSRFLTAEGKKLASKRSGSAARFEAALRAETAMAESGPGWRMLPGEGAARERRVLNMALLLAGDAGRVSQQELAALAAAKEPLRGMNAAERLIIDARQLDDEGALGMAQRLMEIGRRGESMRLIYEKRPDAEYHTRQVRSMAAARRTEAEAFLEALKAEEAEFHGASGIDK